MGSIYALFDADGVILTGFDSYEEALKAWKHHSCSGQIVVMDYHEFWSKMEESMLLITDSDVIEMQEWQEELLAR